MMQFPKPKFRRSVPKRGKRGKFSDETIKAILVRDQGLCQQCGKVGQEIHHVKYKSQSGRGVFTNGLTLCQPCHRKIHTDAELSDYWVNVFVDRYGPDFYKDIYDV